MLRRVKRSTRQYIIVALICIIVIGGAASFTAVLVTGQIREEYQRLVDQANNNLRDNQRKVYVALTDINSGDVILEDMVEEKVVFSSQPQNTYITQKEIGKTALINIPAGTELLQTMLTENSISDELREVEYQVININSNIANNDTVDVRLCYPNGECYVVLSKKIIRGYAEENVICYFWNSEEEILRMQAAIVDASLYPGSTLFMTKYIEPNIQEASVVNYTPSLSILSLIEKDPNIVDRCSQKLNKEIRKSLENRLASSMETDVTSSSWNVPDDQFVEGEKDIEDELETETFNQQTDGEQQMYDEQQAYDEQQTYDDKQTYDAQTRDSANAPVSGELGLSDTQTEEVELGELQSDQYFYYAKEGEFEYDD